MKNILMSQKSALRVVNYMKDSIKVADSLKFKTPKGKLYGGGGIVPDILFL
jgi:hypothetical protein